MLSTGLQISRRQRRFYISISEAPGELYTQNSNFYIRTFLGLGLKPGDRYMYMYMDSLTVIPLYSRPYTVWYAR